MASAETLRPDHTWRFKKQCGGQRDWSEQEGEEVREVGSPDRVGPCFFLYKWIFALPLSEMRGRLGRILSRRIT